jgi:hypothetical protein
MLLKMLNILRMNQILFFRILIMILLPMMDLILILVVAVMSRSPAEIWEFDPLRASDGEFGEGNCARPVSVEEFDDFVDGFVFFLVGDVVGGFVSEAVEVVDVVVGPFVAVVEVVEGEEGAGVEAA